MTPPAILENPGPPCIDALCANVARWAASEPLVKKAYLYGSWVKGTQTPLSDLDVAVELWRGSGDPEPLATWILEARRLRESLSTCVCIAVHLEWYGGQKQTPTVHAGLEGGRRIVYEAPVEPGTQTG